MNRKKILLLTVLVAVLCLSAGYWIGHATTRSLLFLDRYNRQLVKTAQDEWNLYNDAKMQGLLDSFERSHPMQKQFADHYARDFQQSAARNSMDTDREETFFFGDTTLGAFSALFEKNQIDGFRVYLAKYDPKLLMDAGNLHKHCYTVILVATKDSITPNGDTVHADILIPVKGKVQKKPGQYISVPDTYLSIQDYSNPCRPDPCSDQNVILAPATTKK